MELFEKTSYISWESFPTTEFFYVFQEMELSSTKLKKLLNFFYTSGGNLQILKNKNLFYFSKKGFPHISGWLLMNPQNKKITYTLGWLLMKL